MGAGKTAVLVQLASRFAKLKVLPVGIRLRDADQTLDFEQEARKRFQAEIDSQLYSEGQFDRIWRHLRRDRHVVVLADGLEEALSQVRAGEDRLSLIQLAIRRAAETQLPLVITSRYCDPVSAMETTITELEPLGEGPALDFLAPADRSDRKNFARLIEYADLAESPIYLHIIHELDQRMPSRDLAAGQEWLEHTSKHPSDGAVDGQMVDQASLRRDILQDWRNALVDGRLFEDYAVDKRKRDRTLRVLSALACVGLARPACAGSTAAGPADARPAEAGLPRAIQQERRGAQEVRFVDLVGHGETAPDCPAAGIASNLYQELSTKYELRMPPNHHGNEKGHVRWNDDWRDALREECVRAAITGSELGIVEAREDSARFHQSVVQSYLASAEVPDYIERALAAARGTQQPQCQGAPARGQQGKGGDPPEVAELFKDATPEFLAALVMASRVENPARIDQWFTGLCRMAIEHWNPIQAMSLFATAIEIDCFRETPDHNGLVADIAGRWSQLTATDALEKRALVEAKVSLARHIGKAARYLAGRNGMPSARTHGNYRALFEIAAEEGGHSVQLALTQEIGDGGAVALAQLGGREDEHDDRGEFEKWWEEWEKWWQLTTQPPHLRPKPAHDGDDNERKMAHRNARKPDDDKPKEVRDDEETRLSLLRRGVICARLAPLLYSTTDVREGAPSRSGPQSTSEQATGSEPSAQEKKTPDPLANLRLWITEYFGTIDPSHPEKRPWITLEIALAQGFKHAANRRPAQFEMYEKRRSMLIEQAEIALKHSRFWYSQLCLIQALTLLSLPADPDTDLEFRGHGSDPRAQVNYWLKIAGAGDADVEHRTGHHIHPYVREAAELAVNALVTRRPEQFVWIDEAETIKQAGSLPSPEGKAREHRQWILPSFGWSALKPRAQELLGDVLVMLNLATRGEDPQDREARLMRADLPSLPPCLTRDRTSLQVKNTIGSATVAEPGSSCHDDCLFRLCPYPPFGTLPFRAELTEGFCRKLAQEGTPSRYERLRPQAHSDFWQDMAERVRPKIQYGGKPSTQRLKK